MLSDKIKKSPGVYRVFNLLTNDCYVGGSKNVMSRRRQHFSDLKLNKHGNQNLQNAYNEFGRVAFEFQVLQYLPVGCSEDDIINAEQVWIDKLSPQYNVNKIAGKYMGDYIRTAEAIEKRRKKMTGKKYPNRKKMTFKNGINPQIGKFVSQETRDKLSKLMTGAGNPNYGKPKSEETKKRISDGQKRYYSGLIAPDGTVYKDIWHLSQFCREHDLGISSVVALFHGRHKHHKGWTVYREE